MTTIETFFRLFSVKESQRTSSAWQQLGHRGGVAAGGGRREGYQTVIYFILYVEGYVVVYVL